MVEHDGGLFVLVVVVVFVLAGLEKRICCL